MKIIVPNEAPKKMGKALTEAVDLIGAQLNEIAEKYGCNVSAVAYRDKNDGFGQNLYVSVSDAEYLVSVYLYMSGEYAKDTEHASVIKANGR